MDKELSEPKGPLLEPLTPREQDVLHLLAEEKTNREIADELTLAQSTIKWYVRQILAKLDVSDRRAAVTRAARLELIEPHAALPAPPHNLPAATTPFVGREDELAALDRLIVERGTRLITIFGPGGIGKTRLALAAAERQLRRKAPNAVEPSPLFDHGVWFIALTRVRSTGNLPAELAETLRFRFAEEDRRTSEQQLLDYLTGKRMLLVLDNFEHLLAGSPFLMKVLQAAPGVQMIVTSRERLKLQAEYLFAIEGLALPDPEGASQSAIARSAPVQLFLQTARRVQPDLQLDDDDIVQIAGICRVVGEMPLGIELAASWVSVLPLDEIARALRQSLDLLAADFQDLPPRHRSLSATLDASWQRLGEPLKDAFRRLALFRAGFTRPAAAAVADATLPLLVRLVNKSWLAYDPHGDRYHIHELLRQYGRQKLAGEPDVERETVDRLSAFFCERLQQWKDELQGDRQEAAVSEIRADLDNVQVAWEWAVDRGETERIDQALDGLCRFYRWVGRIREGEMACRTAAARLAGIRDREAAPRLLALQARVLIWQSRFTRESGASASLLDKSERLLERAAQAGGETRAERAFLLANQAEEIQARDSQLAIQYYEQALELYRELDEPGGAAVVLDGLGFLNYRLGKLDEARQYAEESLSIREEVGDRLGVANVRDLLALVQKYQGQAEEAAALQRSSLQIYQELGYPLLEITAAGNLANTLWWLGDFEKMLEMAEHAASIQETLGAELTPYVVLTLGRALLHLGHYRRSRAVTERALRSARTTGSRDVLAFILLNLGQLATVEGSYDEAETSLQESVSLFTDLWPNSVVESLACLAYLWLAQDANGRAKDTLDEALQRLLEVRSYFSVLYCLPAAALLAARKGDRERAAELYALAARYDHIGHSCWFEDVAMGELAKVAATPSGGDPATGEREQPEDLWEVATRLLRE